ncbi:MAG: hypothetical protein SGILL_004357 [Bacillariaceae sp.]
MYGPSHPGHTVQLCSGEEYRFVFYDSYGDGLLGEAYYMGTLNGEIIQDLNGLQVYVSGDTGRQEIHDFVVEIPPAPTTSAQPSMSSQPSSAPSMTPQPTSQPSSAPTDGATDCSAEGRVDLPTDCGANLQIEIMTDNHPEDVYWELVETATGVQVSSRSRYSYAQAYTYVGIADTTHVVSLEVGKEYTFIMRDFWGDTLCCKYGCGYYRLSLYGNVLRDGFETPYNFDNDPLVKEELTTFTVQDTPGDCVNSPTRRALRNTEAFADGLYEPELQCPTGVATIVTPEWHPIISENFESENFTLGHYDFELDDYVSGGSWFFARGAPKSPYVKHVRLQYTRTLRINDNDGLETSLFTEPIDMSCFKTVELSFIFMTDHLKAIPGEPDGFVVEYRVLNEYDGFYHIPDPNNSSAPAFAHDHGAWQTMDTVVFGIDFEKNGKENHYWRRFEPSGGQWIQIRIASMADKREYLFFDNWELKGHPESLACSVGGVVDK